MHRSSTYTAMYSQLFKLGAFLSQMHGSAFEGVKFISLRMLCMTSAHFLPEDYNPYNALREIRMYPSNSSIQDQQLCRAFHQYALPPTYLGC